MDSPLLKLAEISKVYGEKVTLNKVNLQVNKGEIIALCGGNGTGKSTLLRIIVGTIAPDHGTISVNGASYTEQQKEYSNYIGYMPDDFQFNQALTAFEQLYFWAKLKRIDKKRVQEVLEEVGLTDVAQKKASSFSKGMKQRLMLAQALLAKPALLIMDEPTNGLDPYWMQTFITNIKQAKTNGQSIIFSTHQLQIAEALADRVIFLENGSFILDGYLEELKQEHGYEGLNKRFSTLFGL